MSDVERGIVCKRESRFDIFLSSFSFFLVRCLVFYFSEDSVLLLIIFVLMRLSAHSIYYLYF